MTEIDSKYPPKSLNEIALDLEVPVSQRGQPDFSVKVPNRFVTLEEANARGMSWCYDPSLGECRFNHLAPRRTSNTQICSDCLRLKEGKDPVYGKSRAANKHYAEPRRKPVDASAPAAPAAPTAPPEMPKKDVELLAKIDDLGDIDKAAAACGWTRGEVEARAVANERFGKSLDALLDLRQIPRTRKVASGFPWTKEIERDLIRRWIDGGLLHLARDETGVSASEYFAHLEASPTFAAMVEAARPLATDSLKDRSLHAAGTGNVKLLEYLTKNAEAETSISNMSTQELDAELRRLIAGFDAQGLIPHPTKYRRLSTGELIDASDMEVAETTHTRSNSDLVE